MKKYIVLLFFFSFAIINTSFTSLNNTWQKAYDANEMIIYTRTTENGIKEFRAITTVNVKIETVVGVMADYKAHPDWMRAIKECKMIEQETATTRYLYYSIDMPWPLWDRDLVSKGSFTLKANGSIFMKMQSVTNKGKKTDDHVRIVSAGGHWEVIPLSKTQTKIIYQYQADPVGIPATLVNMFLLEAPKATFEGLKKQILLPKYKNPDVTWLYK